MLAVDLESRIRADQIADQGSCHVFVGICEPKDAINDFRKHHAPAISMQEIEHFLHQRGIRYQVAWSRHRRHSILSGNLLKRWKQIRY